MVLYQHGISSPEPLKWLLSNLRNSSSCLCVRQYCSSSHMSPNYPRMVFAFFSFLWSSTCCGFRANTICMPDHEVIFFFSKPSLGCSCVWPHHSHCTWVSYEGQPCHARNGCSELQPSASGAWLELESPSSCSVLVCPEKILYLSGLSFTSSELTSSSKKHMAKDVISLIALFPAPFSTPRFLLNQCCELQGKML